VNVKQAALLVQHCW